MNDQEKQLDELRLRLHRRNQLLEIVRKAYHRDILVVREYLLHLQNGVSIDDIKPEDFDLRTIPSIDLRNEGFHLFSPQECELTLKPCFQCGGSLEIIHRESTRYQTLMRCCDDLKTKEEDLDKDLVIARHQVEVEKGTMLKQEAKFIAEQNRLNAEVDRLKKCVADRDELERVCGEQRDQIKELHVVQHQKEELVKKLQQIEHEATLSNSNFERARVTIVDNNSIIGKIRKRCEEGLLREKGLNNRVEQMNNTNIDLRKTIEVLEKLEIQLKDELKICRSELRRYVTFFHIGGMILKYLMPTSFKLIIFIGKITPSLLRMKRTKE
jgi:hypothetical protein